MARLKHRYEVPPLGFWYLQKETALRIEGESLRDTATKVIAHRKYKGLGPLDLATVEREVEQQICSRLGKFHCQADGPDDPWIPRETKSTVLRLGSILAFSRAAFAWFASGRELVTQEKAQARATGCAGCPLNQPLTGCKCGSVLKIIQSVVPAEKRFEKLGVCTVCECSLPAKVWLPRSVVDASNEGRKLRFPTDGSCWQSEIDG